MSVPKVCGIETEYGITVAGADIDSVTASSLVVSAYSDVAEIPTPFDLSQEYPHRDARGVNLDDYLDPEIDSKSVNRVLINGARYYVDHAHPEYSGPECLSIKDVVAFDSAGDEILRSSLRSANQRLPNGIQIALYKNNSDGKGNSYGCHENYLVDRKTPFLQLAHFITAHFVSRQIFCGSGKVGHESPFDTTDLTGYQISQRADFFEEPIGLETTMKRPIVNTRDEPHANQEKYRRLHVIVGDANMSQFATFLKVGTTAIVLSMIEHNMFPESLLIAQPVAAIKQVSHDITLQQKVLMHDGRRLRALEIQSALFEAAESFLHHKECDGLPQDEIESVMHMWAETLHCLDTDASLLHDRIDWIAKLRIIDAYALRHNLSADDPKLKAIDIQYHALDEEKCLAKRLNLQTLVEQQSIRDAMVNPPTNTRAYFRGRVMGKWPAEVVSANWDSMVLEEHNRPLIRIAMDEPTRGNEVLCKSLIDNAATVTDLLAGLSSGPKTADSLEL